MTTSFSTDVKRAAKRNIARSVFGTGVVGRAVLRTWNKKETAEENPVAEALAEQEQVQSQTQSTLTRIENVVTNIADNIYNIAGVWSNHVASMEEANRLQKERISKEQAALEEAQNESAAMLTPLPSGTAVTQESSSEKGILGGLMQSVANTRTLLKGSLKKFALLAAGLAAAGGATVAMAGSANNEEEAAPVSGGVSSESSPAPVPTPTTTTSSTSGVTPAAPAAPTGQASTVTTSAPPTAVAQPSVTSTAATTVAANAPTAAQTKDTPYVVNINNIQHQFKDKQEYEEYTKTPQNFALRPSGNITIVEKTQAAPTTAQSTPPSIPAPDVSSQDPSGSTPTGGSDGAMPSSETASLAPAPTAVPQEQSSGDIINKMSVAVQGMAQQVTQAIKEPTIVASNSESTVDETESSPLPSPIADRGSLDMGTVFNPAV